MIGPSGRDNHFTIDKIYDLIGVKMGPLDGVITWHQCALTLRVFCDNCLESLYDKFRSFITYLILRVRIVNLESREGYLSSVFFMH